MNIYNSVDLLTCYKHEESDRNTSLGFCYGLEGESPILLLFNKIDSAPLTTTKLPIRRAVWKKCFDGDTNYIILLEFGWLNSGMLYVRAEVRFVQFNTTLESNHRAPLSAYVDIRLFSATNAQMMLRTSEKLDELINENPVSDVPSPIQDMSYLFKPPFECLSVIISGAVQFNEEGISTTFHNQTSVGSSEENTEFSVMESNLKIDSELNVTQLWNEITHIASRCNRYSTAKIGIFKRPFGQKANLENLQCPFHISCLTDVSTDLKTKNKIRDICDQFGIKLDSPQTDNSFLGVWNDIEPGDEDLCIKQLINEEMKSNNSDRFDEFLQSLEIFCFSSQKKIKDDAQATEKIEMQDEYFSDGSIASLSLAYPGGSLSRDAYEFQGEGEKEGSVVSNPGIQPTRLDDGDLQLRQDLIDADISELKDVDNRSSSIDMYGVKKVIDGSHVFWECRYCAKKFKDKRGNLIRHVKNVHIKSTLFICEQDGCRSKFPSHSNLRRHIQTVHEGRKFGCQICTRRFRTLESLNVHNRSVHEKTRNICSCSECGGSFSRWGSLKRHKEQVHGHMKRKKPIESTSAT